MLGVIKFILRILTAGRHAIERILTLISLTFVYFLGVGTSAVIARVIGKKFLDTSFSSRSSWKKYRASKNVEKMF